MLNLGKVAVTPRGSWYGEVPYERLDLVEYKGSSYLALKANTGEQPDISTESWQLYMRGYTSTKYNVSIPKTGWTGGACPYSNIVQVNGVTEDQDLQLIGIDIPSGKTAAEVRAINKAAGFLIGNDTGVTENTITFLAYEKPEVDFSVTLVTV